MYSGVCELESPTLGMKTSVLAHQEGTDTAALFLEGKLLQAVINIQSYLYKLIEMEEETGNHDKAEKIAEITDHMISCLLYTSRCV